MGSFYDPDERQPTVAEGTVGRGRTARVPALLATVQGVADRADQLADGHVLVVVAVECGAGTELPAAERDVHAGDQLTDRDAAAAIAIADAGAARGRGRIGRARTKAEIERSADTADVVDDAA